MNILMIDTSGPACGVAVSRDGQIVCELQLTSGKTHSQRVMPMVDQALALCEMAVGDVDLFGAVVGPGSFTGVRIGVSTVKGLSWAADKPCVGVSTLEAMAWHGLMAGGYVCPVMDARRQQVYNALFKIEDGKPQRITDDRPIALAQLADEVRSLDAPVLLVGDGAALTERFFRENSVPCRIAPENLRWQSAWGVAMAASDKQPGTSETLLPVYLRLSQAERERQERLSADK